MRSTRNTRMFQAISLAGLLAAALPAGAQSTAFTYQGQLDVTGTQAASYDFQADVFATACTVEPCTGTALNPAPMLFPGVTLVQGRFLLSVDPGAAVFNGEERFLQLRVRRTGTGSFTTLLPRQEIIATPYAQHAADADFAATVAPGSVGATQLGTAVVGTVQINASQVQRRINGSCPAGSAMRAVDVGGTAPTCEPILGTSGLWSTSGNAATATQFLGTTNAQPLELHSNNKRVARLEATSTGLTNVMLGIASNVIDAGVNGATIGGGGQIGKFNRVTDDFGTIGGGIDNRAGDGIGTLTDRRYATISGGEGNIAGGEESTVGGGSKNTASELWSTVGGGTSNDATGNASTVGGGSANAATGNRSTVGGGSQNGSLGQNSTVGGGFANCAGGGNSWAGGARAKVRTPSGTGADPEGSACDNVENASSASGDAGTFVWADDQGSSFVSNGPNRFLMRVQDGMTVQRTGNQARSRGYFNVLRGDSGLPQAVISSTAVAVFENADGADLHIIAGGTGNKSLRFGDATDAFQGGILYTPTHNMQFRADGNVTRMTLNANGNLTLTGLLTVPSLGSAGSTSLCRNASNQLATCSSSARYKQAITALGLGLDAVLRLRPVGYEWKDSGMPDVGFVAEEVAQIDERLITRNEKGQVEGVRYERLTAVLAGAVQELAARESLARESNEALRADVDALRAELAQLRALLVRKEH